MTPELKVKVKLNFPKLDPAQTIEQNKQGPAPFFSRYFLVAEMLEIG